MDPQEVPSKAEIKKTKKEIESLEKELVAAESVVANLKRMILERRAYIAPIRTLPYEIISGIFVDMCRKNPLAPLLLQSVCRTWRAVILNTPLCWSFIPNYGFCDEGYDLTCAYLDRSGNAGLHLSVPNHSSPEAISKLQNLGERIQCIQGHPEIIAPMIFSLPAFSSLEKISIYILPRRRITRKEPATEWNMGNFPKLRCLCISMQDECITSIAASIEFPPLTELMVKCNDLSPMNLILSKCSQSIRYVHLDYDECSTKDNEEALQSFPNLHFLRLVKRSKRNSPTWRFKGLTPRLKLYSEEGFTGARIDIDNLVFLGIDRKINLSPYSRIERLYLDLYVPHLLDIARELHDHSELCPRLTLITYARKTDTYQYISDATELLKRRAEITGVKVKIVEVTNEYRLLDALEDMIEVCYFRFFDESFKS